MNEIVADIPRLYTALAEWIACVSYIAVLRKKHKGWKLVAILGSALCVQSLFIVMTGDLPIVFWIPVMLVAISMIFVLILLCCDITVYEALYYTARAFVAAEFVASLVWQVHFFIWNGAKPELFFSCSLLIIIYGAFFILVRVIEKHQMPEEGRLNINQREMWSTVIIGAAVFAISNLSFMTSRTPFSGQYSQEIIKIRTLVDLGGLAILYAYHIQLNELRIKHELKAVQNILQNQYLQYQNSRESIELINFKYHDLKNQIIALKAEEDANKRYASLTQIENDIKFYEAQNKTGNKVLDTVLTTKQMHCIKNEIKLTCVVDGTLLNDMETMDICTIFGNALDNAIEYEMKIEDREKRLIHVSLFSQKSFVLIRFESYFEGELKLVGGLPVTTKKDKDNHGYGLRSIQYAVQKYGGGLSVSHKDSWFELKILLPQ